MHRLRLLGNIGLSTDAGEDVDALLRQPKRIALLAYLAMPQPGAWHRRDSVLAVFWGEHDQAAARTALRSAIYGLRRHLPEGAIRARGDDEIGLNPALITTDVAEMVSDIAEGRHEEALAKYHGDFLDALHASDATGFEKWCDAERRRLKNLALKEASALAEDRKQAGDLAGAVDAARRASELDPDDESAARRWIALLDKTGDRAQAFAVYQRFRNHMSEEFGVRPSAETVALVDAVRVRQSVAEPARAASTTQSSHESAIQNLPDDTPGSSVEGARQHVDVPPTSANQKLSRLAGRGWRWAALAIPLIAAGMWAAFTRPSGASAPVERRLVVLPMENETGNPKFDYIASGVAEGVAKKLEGIGGLTIRSGARSDWPSAVRHDYKAIGRDFGATILLKTTLASVMDSLEIRMSVVDAATSGERVIAGRRFGTSQLSDVESALAAAVAGAVFRVPLPAVPRALRHPVDPESYRLMLDGFHQFLALRNRQEAARQLFLQATAIDPRNARAWSGLSSVWANMAFGALVPWEVGYDRSSAAAARALALDSLQGSAWANLGFLRAVRYQSLQVGSELLKKAIAAEPGNPEVFLVKSALLRQAHKWDESIDAIRVARALDPLTSRYADREAFVNLCADRPIKALNIYEAMLAENPADSRALSGRIRTLARLGRYDDAIKAWRAKATADGDTAIVHALENAKGRTDYWNARHLAARLDAGANQLQTRSSSNARLQEQFAVGDIEGGFATLEGPPENRVRSFLPCAPGFDEVRETPRFKAIVVRTGGLPER